MYHCKTEQDQGIVCVTGKLAVFISRHAVAIPVILLFRGIHIDIFICLSLQCYWIINIIGYKHELTQPANLP